MSIDSSAAMAIATPNLRLEPLAPRDLPDLCRLYRDPRVMATLGGLRPAATTWTQLRDAVRHWEEHGFGIWSLRAGGRFAGRGGLRLVELDGRPEVELLWAVRSDLHGRGLATELARAAARFAFESVGLREVVAFTLPSNRASERVMLKLGMRWGRITRRGSSPLLVYRLRARDWKRQGPHGLEPGRR